MKNKWTKRVERIKGIQQKIVMTDESSEDLWKKMRRIRERENIKVKKNIGKKNERKKEIK